MKTGHYIAIGTVLIAIVAGIAIYRKRQRERMESDLEEVGEDRTALKLLSYASLVAVYKAIPIKRQRNP